MHRRPTSALRLLAALAALVALTLSAGIATPAGADEDHDETTTTVTVPGGYVLAEGYVVGGATVTCPGKPDQTWEAEQAAAFVESLIAEMTFGSPTLQEPPAGVPVCKVVSTGLFGTTTTPGTFVISYASQGDTAWAQQEGNAWFAAPARTKGAFEGTVKPTRPSLDLSAKATTTTTTEAKASGGGDDDEASNLVPVLVGGALIGAALIGAVVWRQRRSGSRGEA